MLEVEITRTPEGEGLPLPTYATQGAAGMDLYAAIEEPLTLSPGKWMLISTGIKIALPPGYEAQVRPRSGLALRHGITLVNTPGTIDSDYRGTVGVILINLGESPFVVTRGDRIAQMVIAPVLRTTWTLVDTLSASDRGPGGFGHTGK